MKKDLKVMKNQGQKKNISTKLLVKRALKTIKGPQPRKGYKFIKDIDDGTMIHTEFGTVAVKIRSTDSSTEVIVTEHNCRPEDDSYYLGRQLWSSRTQIKT